MERHCVDILAGSPERREALIRTMRELTPTQKYRMACGFTQLTRDLARAVLRVRHPDASETELRYRFAMWALGPELAAKAYGPPPWDEEPEGS